MNIHKKIDDFQVFLSDIHKKTGYRLDVLEKDYYVVLILEELSKMQERGLPAYFKGGTALYKALHTTNRFSEDIDLSVDTRGLSRSQNDKILEKATKKYISLKRDPSLGITNRSEIIQVYTYEPLVKFDKDDMLQRFGKVKIEATSFTISEPIMSLEVAPIIYELATKEQKQILENVFDVKPFNVLTITLERIFVDKLFAAESYVRKAEEKERALEAAKHLYDLTIMFRMPQIFNLMNNEKLLRTLLNIRMKEEINRLDGIPKILPREFIFFDNLKDNDLIINAYETMENRYVLNENDKISYEDIIKEIKKIREELSKKNAWNNAELPILYIENNYDYNENNIDDEEPPTPHRGMHR